MALGDIIGRILYTTEIDNDRLRSGTKEAEAQVQASMQRIERMEAHAKVGANIRELEKGVAEAKREILTLDEMQADPEARLDTKQYKADRAALMLSLRRLQQERVELAVDSKQLVMAEKDAERLNAELRNTETTFRKSRAEIVKNERDLARLRLRYAQLNSQIKELSKPGGFGGLFGRSRLQSAALAAEMDHISQRIRRLGGDTDNLDDDIDEHRSRLVRWASSLANVRVHLGIMSLTLKQTGIALLTLGPLLTGLIGAASALIGVIGTSLAGALSVTTAAALGFGFSLFGIVKIMKPLVKETKDALAASTAYDAAVRKYGEGSSEAGKKLEQLNHTLKDISPRSREAFKSFGAMRTEWDKLTSDARQPFFDTMAEGIRTANSLLPMFARESTKTFNVAAAGVRSWLEELRGPAARSGIEEIMHNFRASLPGLFDGLTSIGRMLGRIGQVASRFLPGLTRGFADWAESLNQSVGRGTALEGKIGRLIQHMRDFGHFAQAAGRLMVNFFGIGADAGDGLLNALTRSMNRWSEWMNTVEGENSLQDFFNDSVTTTEQLFTALAGVGQLLLGLSRTAAPLVQGMMRVATTTGNIVHSISQFRPAKAAIAGIGAAFATWWGIGKIAAAAGAIRAVYTAITTLAAARGSIAALGLTMSTAFTPLRAIAAVAAGVAVGISFLADDTDDAADSMDEFAQNTRDAENALKSLGDADLDAAEANIQYSQALTAKTRAHREVTRLQEAGVRGSLLYKEAVDNARAADIQATRAKRDLAAAERKVGHETNTIYNSRAKNVGILRGIARAEKERLQDMRALGDAYTEEDIVGQEEALADARRDLAGATRGFGSAQDQANLSQLNAIRAQDKQEPILRRHARLYAQLARAVGTRLAVKVARIDDRQASATVARLSRNLSQLGQGQVVKNILVNAKGDDQTIQALRTVNRLTQAKREHTVDIRERGGQRVMNMLNQIARKKLREIVQDVTGNRDPWNRTIAIVASAILRPLDQIIRGDASPVQSVLSWLAGLVLPPLEQPIHTTRTNAMGGTMYKAPGEGSTGGQYNRPTAINGRYSVGEEYRREFVIAENPAYRHANEGYLQSAAAALGYVALPRYAGGGEFPKGAEGKPKYDYARGQITFFDNQYQGRYSAQTQDISANRIADYNYASLLDPLHREEHWYGILKGTLGTMISEMQGQMTTNRRQNNGTKGKPGAKDELKRLRRELGDAKDELGRLKGKPGDKAEKRRSHLRDHIGEIRTRISREESTITGNQQANESMFERIGQLKRELSQTIPGEMGNLALQIQQVEDARSGLVPLGGGAGGTTPTAGAEMFIGSQEAYNLIRDFGGNFAPMVSGFAGGAGITGPGTGGFYPQTGASALLMRSGGSGAAPSGGGGSTAPQVTQNITIAQAPPDPHVFSQQVAWEAAATGY